MSTAQQNEAEMAAESGRVVLWVGNEGEQWNAGQFASVAREARSWGVDTLCAKVANGGQKLYGNVENLKAIRQAVLNEGCGFIPFNYLYGPKFGDSQIHDEAAILAEMMSVCPVVQADMEVEWNNQPQAAALLCELMRPVSGYLSVSTWADPNQQAWQGVIKALAPCVNAWTPQQYTDWLAAQEQGGQLAGMGLTIQPGIDLRPEFGSDHVMSIVQQAIDHHHATVYLWEYQSAQANPGLVKQVCAAMDAAFPKASAPAPTPPAPAPSPAPAPTPAPAPAPHGVYVVESGDTLSGIAAKLHLVNWYTDLYLPNRNEIEAVARSHGQRDSHGGSLIYPGEPLRYG